MADEKALGGVLQGDATLHTEVGEESLLAFAYEVEGEGDWLHIEYFRSDNSRRGSERFTSVIDWLDRVRDIAALSSWAVLPPVDEVLEES